MGTNKKEEIKKGILALAKLCINEISNEKENAETSFGKIKTVMNITEKTLAQLNELIEEEQKIDEKGA